MGRIFEHTIDTIITDAIGITVGMNIVPEFICFRAEAIQPAIFSSEP